MTRGVRGTLKMRGAVGFIVGCDDLDKRAARRDAREGIRENQLLRSEGLLPRARRRVKKLFLKVR